VSRQRGAPANRRSTPPREAIVLSSMDFGESDRIVRLLTPDLGRVPAIARRARSDRRRFGGALDTGNLVEVRVRPGRGELWTLEGAKLLDGREGARSDLVRLTLLAYACELCGALSREAHAEPRMFGLLEMTTLLLDAMTTEPGTAFRVGFEAKALTFAGLSPALTRCAHCGEPPEPGMRFHPAGGGAGHGRCEALGQPVTPAWLTAVESARRTPLRELVDTPLPPGPAWALSDAVQAHLGRALKSRRVLASLLPVVGADTVPP
jgi:DNA repair protein RecO (recombination protein O)